MPLVEVTLAAGRSPEQVRRMIHEVHEAVLRTVDTRPEHIRVIVREVPRDHWATGDVTLGEMDAAAGTKGRNEAPLRGQVLAQVPADTPRATEETP